MAAAMTWLSAINGRHVSAIPLPLGSINATANRARARARVLVPSFPFSSPPLLRSGSGTSLLVPLYSDSKKKRNKFLVITTGALTTQSQSPWQWEEEEGEEEEEEEEENNTQRQRQGQGRPREANGVSFFVGNLPYSVDSAELLELIKDVGNVTMVEVIYNKETGRSRGFAFVRMATADDVSKAVERFNGYEYQGRTLRVSSGPPPAKNDFSPRNESVDSANQVFVGNLPWGADNLTLEQLFRDHGKVKDVRIVYDRETGRSRGFGFVTMSSSPEVEAAVSSLDGADMDGRALRVMVADTKPGRF